MFKLLLAIDYTYQNKKAPGWHSGAFFVFLVEMGGGPSTVLDHGELRGMMPHTSFMNVVGDSLDFFTIDL